MTFATLLSIPTVWLLSIAISRPLRMDFSLLRRLAAGLFAFAIAADVILAITPADALASGATEAFPAFWYVLLGALLSVVAAMVLLVLAEALVPSGSLPGPVTLVRAAPRWARRTRRYLRIARILVRHGLGAYVFTRQRPDLSTSDGRRRLARSLAGALDDAGVTFVKLGQILATRADLLPAEFVDELGRLQSAAAPVPWDEVRAIVAAEIGDDLRLDPEPLAAASIAQVHAARLPDGSDVVVKVRRPGIEQVVAGDLDILDRIAHRLERSTRWGRSFGVLGLADGFAASLREELDFRVEARNIGAVAAAAALRGVDDVVYTPRVHHATRRVLVMERFSGVPVGSAGPDPAGAAALLDCLLGQILLDGVFHADPHPGNVLVLDDGHLGLLDLGSVGRLDGALRASLQGLLLALDRDDPAAVVDALLELTAAPDELDERALRRDTGRFLARHLGPGATLAGRLSLGATIGELFALLARHHLAAPAELAAVLRAIGTCEGTLTRLDPGFDVVAGARAFATRQVAARMEPAAVRRAVTDELAAMLPLVRRLPRRVDRIVAALDSGRLTVRVAAQTPAVSGATLSAVLVTGIAATTGLMAALLLVAAGGPRLTTTMTVDQLIGYLLLIVSAILGLRVLGQVYRGPRADE